MVQNRSLMFLILGVLVAGFVFAGGQQQEEEGTEVSMEGLESPMLAEMVSAGALPPVEERLPANPMVVEPLEEPGEYGGTWNTALIGSGDRSWIQLTVGYEPLVRWTPDWTTTIPNIAERVEVNSDSTRFVFHLREGMKWSDGAPFNADNFMFWYEDILLNEELTDRFPGMLRVGDEPVVIEKIDDYTVAFTFAGPYGFFLQELAESNGSRLYANLASHYLKQFHIDYNEDANAVAEEAGYDDWTEYFSFLIDSTGRWRYVGLPTIHGWMMTTPYDGNTSRVVFERNPYYWKVDPAGRQLPYIDRVVFNVVEDDEVLLLQVLNGENDFQIRHIYETSFRAPLVDNQERGGYDLIEIVQAWSNSCVISLNMTHKDEMKREIFADKDFRIGLSHAINRQEIIDLIQFGQSEPFQSAARPGALLYDEEMAKQYTEFDVDVAAEYLDEVLPEKDSNGFRLMPNGERLTVLVEVDVNEQEMIDIMELVVGYWAAVGVDTQLRPVERSLLDERTENNETDAVLWVGGGGLDQLILSDPTWFMPDTSNAFYALAWGAWAQNPENPVAEEPPTMVLEQYELYEEIRASSDSDRQIELMREIMETAKDQFWTIGTTLQPTGLAAKTERMRNIPDSIIQTWSYQTPGPTNPEQYWIDE
jgi:peptide/nickel transport system substrate-binding protein